MNKKSACGSAELDIDMNASAPYSKEPVENMFAGNPEKSIEAPHGTYKVGAQRGDHTFGPPADLCPPLGSARRLILCSLSGLGRPLNLVPTFWRCRSLDWCPILSLGRFACTIVPITATSCQSHATYHSQ